jgi:hypothetical protein
VKIGSTTINPETGKFSTTLTFTKPVQKLLMDSLFLKVDTTATLSFTAEELIYRPKQKEYLMTKELGRKMFGADANPSIVLMMKKAFAISIDGDSSKATSQQVVIYWPEENGVVSIQANTKRKNYIIQLLEKSRPDVIHQTINNPKLTAKNIPPGDYRIRAIIDTNGNGKWDPGNIRKGTEPEKIIFYVAPDGSTAFPVRANWEVGPLTFAF